VQSDADAQSGTEDSMSTTEAPPWGSKIPVAHERCDPKPGFEGTWSNRYAAALVRHADAKAAADREPKNEDLARAVMDSMADVHAIAEAAAADWLFMLRKANDLSGLALRRLLTAVIGDVVDGRLDELRGDVTELAEKVIDLEEAQNRRRVVR
jgi:hypothetical protein